MDNDILVHHPTYAVIMIGMNDVIRPYYTRGADTIPNILLKRSQAVDTYRQNLESIIRILTTRKIKVILRQPSIYDQTAKTPAGNSYGVNDALKICAAYMADFAEKYHLQIVDYWTILRDVNEILQKKDSTATIIGPDRIHPGVAGHMVMAYQFLTSTGAPKDVSRIIVYKDNAKTQNNSKNCEITGKTFNGKGSHLK
jgi:endoglucanase